MKQLIIHLFHLINVNITAEDWDAIKDWLTVIAGGITMVLAVISPIASLLLPPLMVILVIVRIYYYIKKPKQ